MWMLLKCYIQLYLLLKCTRSCVMKHSNAPNSHANSYQLSSAKSITDHYNTKIIEVAVIVDHKLFTNLNSDIKQVEEFVLRVVSFCSNIFRLHNFRVALVGLEVWEDSDKFVISSNVGQNMKPLDDYRHNQLLNKYKNHDVSVLLTGVKFLHNVNGMAYGNQICSSAPVTVVSVWQPQPDVQFAGKTLAHEIGHILGLIHDHPARNCHCPDGPGGCVMALDRYYTGSGPEISAGKIPQFSSCGADWLNTKVVLKKCLDNYPETMHGGRPICGNGFVEAGEECDCGSYETCVKVDPCCQPTGCKLKPHSECYDGDCCENCKFANRGILCRKANSDCDVPEFCPGNSATCPADGFREDGLECGGDGFCRGGSCTSLDNQCFEMWGRASKGAADKKCYQKNSLGDWNGNCGGINSNSFIKCNRDSITCGLLFCHVDDGATYDYKHEKRPMLFRQDNRLNSTHQCTFATRISGITPATDIGLARDGTKCGKNMWCESGKCVGFTPPKGNSNDRKSEEEKTNIPMDVACEVSGWSSWSVCSADCWSGEGDVPTMFRSRTVLKMTQAGGENCPALSEKRSCVPMPPRCNDENDDCEGSSWSKWSECNGKCGAGRKSRTRVVKQQNRCSEKVEHKTCAVRPRWSKWTPCDCGTKRQTKHRMIKKMFSKSCKKQIRRRKCTPKAEQC